MNSMPTLQIMLDEINDNDIVIQVILSNINLHKPTIITYKHNDKNTAISYVLDEISKQYPTIIQMQNNIKPKTRTIKANVVITTNAEKSILVFDCAVTFGISGNHKTIFKGYVQLHCHFGKDIHLQGCEFCENFIVMGCDFYQNVSFDNSIFRKSAIFSENQFNKVASFREVTFKVMPNFNCSIFNGSLNLVNSNLNFDFDECDKVTNDEQKKQENGNSTHCDKDKIANDFRDSFRRFKNALIKDNNLLDASNYHKIELYFKEIELDSKKPKNFGEWIDLWQLKFYRLTSNHHTDLLKSFNSLIILIGVFTLLGLGIMAGFNKCLGFYDSNPHAMIEFYNAHIKNAVINYEWITFTFNAFLSLVFVGLFLFLQICNLARKIGIGLCYILTFIMLISSPKYLIPAIGIFTDRRILLDPLAINGSLYTIFFGFMIYSFIKTARRNSIIPA